MTGAPACTCQSGPVFRRGLEEMTSWGPCQPDYFPEFCGSANPPSPQKCYQYQNGLCFICSTPEQRGWTGPQGCQHHVDTLEENRRTFTLCSFIASITVCVSSGLLDVLPQKLLLHHNYMQVMKLSRGNGVECAPFSSVQVLIKKTNIQPYT